MAREEEMARPERLIPRYARHPFGAHFVRPESLRDSVELSTGPIETLYNSITT
jgi:hypothetical protein